MRHIIVAIVLALSGCATYHIQVTPPAPVEDDGGDDAVVGRPFCETSFHGECEFYQT